MLSFKIVLFAVCLSFAASGAPAQDTGPAVPAGKTVREKTLEKKAARWKRKFDFERTEHEATRLQEEIYSELFKDVEKRDGTRTAIAEVRRVRYETLAYNFLPGWGWAREGETVRAWLYGTTFALALGVSLTRYSATIAHERELNRRLVPVALFAATTEPGTAAGVYHELYVRQYNTVEASKIRTLQAAWLAVFVYAVNLGDSWLYGYVHPEPPLKDNRYKPGGIGLGLRLSF